jgi:receptor expression-enhancing protein 1/2/3/4
MACYTGAETVADYFIFWIPMYYELKVAFVLWLSLPTTNGARWLYKNHIDPFLKQNEQLIDSRLKQIEKHGRQLVYQQWTRVKYLLIRILLVCFAYSGIPTGIEE